MSYHDCKAAEDFAALSTTITSVYDLRGIGVSAVYVGRETWDWMQEQDAKKRNTTRSLVTGYRLVHPDQDYDEADVEFHKTKSGALVATMKPYGADRKIPVKVKFSGECPWKIVVGYKKEDGE